MPQTHCHTLDNGLTLLLRPIENVATISSWIFYRVGSRNESPGQTGISHWVEHMAFKGTPSLSKGEIARLVNRHGGFWNGMTYYDWTTYFETLPAEHLDLALRIESDRMINVRFPPAEVEAERTVILAEREGYENSPAYLLGEEIATQALRIHPYRQPIIGWEDDLRRISQQELLGHYRTYYAPNNAILVLAGAMNVQDAIARVARAFGAIPQGPPIPPQRIVEPPQQAERRLILRRPGPTPILQIAFLSPCAADPDLAAFLVLDAVLSGAKPMAFMGGSPATHRSARLYRALVETEWTVSAHSSFRFSLDPGLFSIRAVLRADRTLEEVEPRLLAELQRMVDDPPDAAEVARTARQLQAQLAYGRESSTDQAYWLGSLAIADQPKQLDTLLEEVAAVQPADVQRVAARYLVPERRTIGWFVPTDSASPPPFAVSSTVAIEETGDKRTGERGKKEIERPVDEGSGEEVDGGTGEQRDGEMGKTVAEGALTAPTVPPCPLPAAAIVRQILPGSTVLLVRANHAHPLVAVAGYVRAGSLHEPIGQEGLARATAAMLSRGTTSRSFHEIHELLEGLGAGLEFGGRTYNTYFQGQALAEDMPTLLELLVEMLRRPSFPESEWQRLCGEMLTRLRYLEDDPGYVANRAFHELLYPAEHPLRRRFEGTDESLSSLTVADLAAFHERHVHAANLVIAISGDIEPAQVAERLTDLLAGWAPRTVLERPDVPAVARPAEIRRVTQHIPGKRQANLVLGFPGPARTAPDYYAALLGNIVLGELGMMGRLGANVRDKQGLAYSVTSALESGADTGLWTVRAGVAPAQVAPTIAGIRAEIAHFLAQGPTPEEYADTASYLTGHLPLALETNGGVASHLLAMERFDLGLDYVERYTEILEGITPTAMVEAARRYLSANEYVLAIAGPIQE